MKKILFLILFLTGLTPVFKNNTLDLICYQSYGQEDPWGDELEDVIICNDPDDITVYDYGSYTITETCVSGNKDGIATNECVWNCSSVRNDKQDDGSGGGGDSDTPDCNGEPGGSAYQASCGCIGGSTGINSCEPDTPPCEITCPEGFRETNYCSCVPIPTCTRTCPTGYRLVNCECVQIPTDCAGVSGGYAYVTTCGCIGGTTGFTSCPTDCDAAKKTETLANNSIISSQNSLIQSNTDTFNKEYGVEQKLTTFPPGNNTVYKNLTVRTDNQASSFTPHFSWNATDGYMVGASHGHPGDGGPSPADLVYAYGNLNHVDLVAGGQTAIDYYKSNFSVTVANTNESYVIKVKDWTALATLYNAFKTNPGAANTAWANEATAYSQANNSATYADLTVAAGLKLYGSAITILKKSAGSTDYEPVTLDANNKVTKTPCPK